MQIQTSTMGAFSTQDSIGTPIVLHWERIDGKSQRLNQKIREVASILSDAYTKQELGFAKAHPQTVANQYFLTTIAPLFREGVEKVDWAQAQVQLSDTFNEMFTSSDFEQYVSDNETSIFVVARAMGNDTPLGVVQFLLTPDFPQGTVKSAYFGVAQQAQNREIELLLLSSAFKILAGVQRIFMHTRSTNETMIALYQSMGFNQFEGTLPYWIDLEYLTSNAQCLQEASNRLHRIEFSSAQDVVH